MSSTFLNPNIKFRFRLFDRERLGVGGARVLAVDRLRIETVLVKFIET